MIPAYLFPKPPVCWFLIILLGNRQIESGNHGGCLYALTFHLHMDPHLLPMEATTVWITSSELHTTRSLVTLTFLPISCAELLNQIWGRAGLKYSCGLPHPSGPLVPTAASSAAKEHWGGGSPFQGFQSKRSSGCNFSMCDWQRWHDQVELRRPGDAMNHGQP